MATRLIPSRPILVLIEQCILKYSKINRFETTSNGYLGNNGTSAIGSKIITIPAGVSIVSIFTDNFYGDTTISVVGATPILSTNILTHNYSIGGNAISTHLYTFVFELYSETNVTFNFSMSCVGCYTIISR